MSFIESLEFDNNMRYLIGFGGTKFLQLKLDEAGEAKVYDLNRGVTLSKYEKILDLNFTSTDNPNKFNECKLACKIAENNQISVFDFDFLKTATYQQKMQYENQNLDISTKNSKNRESICANSDRE